MTSLSYYHLPPAPSAPEPVRVPRRDWIRVAIPLMGGIIPVGAYFLESSGYDAEARMLFVTWAVVGAAVAGLAVFQEIEREQLAERERAAGLV